MPLLSDLLADIPVSANLDGNAAVVIKGITTDSRRVEAGFLYVAVRGTAADGHDYIAQAVKAGAVAVVVESDAVELPAGMALVQVENSREALAYLAAAFMPEHPRHVVAVTGTDGKTSTAEFTRQLAVLTGHRAASIGTLGVRTDDDAINAMFAASHTSPDPMVLHSMLMHIARAGIDVVAMEASSHGIHQHRMDGVAIEAAAFTNLTRDHLDYHGTAEAYADAKLRLFSEVLPEGKTVVVNMDDALSQRIVAIATARGCRVVGYGERGDTLTIERIRAHAKGLSAHVRVDGEERIIDTDLFGAFQIQNMLAAVGLVHAMGAPLSELIPLCPRLRGVPGRMERVATHPNGAGIFIDYAHTPAALQKVLEVARPHITGALHVVFGCGGDRDTGKRPLMGAVAQDYADHVIVTDDNPRSEDPAAIRAAVISACPKALEIGDRADAIAVAIRNLQSQDALIVAGKGHETTQTIGQQIFPFNDAEAIKEALARL